MEIKARDAEESWKKALEYVINNGKEFQDRDSRNCKEVMNLLIRFDNLKSIVKPIEILNSFKKWVYPPLEELEGFILSKKDIPGYYYNYGARAFGFNGVNQIDNFIVPLLKKDKSSRRASVVFYNPGEDSSLLRKDIPGMIMMNFNIREEKLHAVAVIRSNDLFFGWPANVYQTYILLKYVAESLNLELGSITTVSISAHIFEDQFEHIRKVIC